VPARRRLGKAGQAVACQAISPLVGELEEVAGGVLLRGGVSDVEWMARYLVGTGLAFAVRRPAELRAALRRLAAAVAALAERGG